MCGERKRICYDLENCPKRISAEFSLSQIHYRFSAMLVFDSLYRIRRETAFLSGTFFISEKLFDRNNLVHRCRFFSEFSAIHAIRCEVRKNPKQIQIPARRENVKLRKRAK